MRLMSSPSLQEFFLLHIVGTDAIRSFHLFELLGREIRKMPNELNEFPCVVILVLPGRHSGEANAIPDDGEQFAVTESLRGSLSHVRRVRIQILSHFGLPAAVVAVTFRAVIGEMLAALGKRRRGEGHRISRSP